MLVGGFLAGVLSDRWGRKRMLLASLGINAVFGFLSATNPSSWVQLALCRVCAGVGVGGSIPAVFTLYAEYLPTRRRGFYLSIVAWFWMVGSVFTAGLAWVVLGQLQWQWNYFAYICVAPATVAFVLALFLLPESPR